VKQAEQRLGAAELDEPTSNLDMASMRRLTEALRCYRGGLSAAWWRHR
jgi:DNA repair exonuclease SbcCD ATPase subunit